MTVFGRLPPIAGCLLALTSPALADGHTARISCADRSEMIAHLHGKFHESQTGAGLQSRSHIVEVWASETGSWTIVATDAKGVSCILASGTHWRESEPVVGVEG